MTGNLFAVGAASFAVCWCLVNTAAAAVVAGGRRPWCCHLFPVWVVTAAPAPVAVAVAGAAALFTDHVAGWLAAVLMVAAVTAVVNRWARRRVVSRTRRSSRAVPPHGDAPSR